MTKSNNYSANINKAWNLRFSDPDRSYSIASRLAGHDELTNAYSNLVIANYYFLRSDNHRVLSQLLDCEPFFKTNAHEWGYVVWLYLKANIYDGFGDYEKALSLGQRSVSVAREQRYDEGLADALNVLGQIYSRLTDYVQAEEYYKECLAIRRKRDDQAAVASTLSRLGRLYCQIREFVQSEKHYKESIQLRKDGYGKGALSWSYLGLAEMYYSSERFEDSITFFNASLDATRDARCNQQAYHGMGKVMLANEEHHKAIDHLTKALKMAQELNALPLERDTLKSMAAYHEKLGHFKDALRTYKLYDALKEKILNEDKLNTIKQQQISFATEQSRKEAEIHRLKNVELKNALDDVHAGITYASYVQQAIMTDVKEIKRYLPDSFVFFRPKDVVSGDFYFFEEESGKLFFSGADCTGHGVPGSLMSMLGYNFLSQAVHEKGLTQPGEILSYLDKCINDSLKQSSPDAKIKDGMDLGLCMLDRKNRILQYAGAYNPLYFIRKGEGGAEFNEFPEKQQLSYGQYSLYEIKADKFPIGSNKDGIADQYTNHEFSIQPGDTVYLFSDGYADQFGGEKGKKFKYKQLKELLLSIQDRNMEEQETIIANTFDDWIEGYEQIDDVVIFGVRI